MEGQTGRREVGGDVAIVAKGVDAEGAVQAAQKLLVLDPRLARLLVVPGGFRACAVAMDADDAGGSNGFWSARSGFVLGLESLAIAPATHSGTSRTCFICSC